MSDSNLFTILGHPPGKIRSLGKRLRKTQLGDVRIGDAVRGFRLPTQLVHSLSFTALELLLLQSPIILDRDNNLLAGLRSYRLVIEMVSLSGKDPRDLVIPAVIADIRHASTPPQTADVLAQLLGSMPFRVEPFDFKGRRQVGHREAQADARACCR